MKNCTWLGCPTDLVCIRRGRPGSSAAGPALLQPARRDRGRSWLS